MKTLILVLVLSLFSTVAFAQEKEQPKQSTADPTVLKILDAAKEGANAVIDAGKKYAPVAYSVVRQRVKAESIVMLVVPPSLFLIFLLLTGLFFNDWEGADLALGILSGIALLASLILIPMAILDLLSLDYVTAGRIMSMLRGGCN